MAASAEPPVTRNTVRSYIVPSLKRCVGSELPANSPATYNDILCYRKLLVDRDPGLVKKPSTLYRLILSQVMIPWEKIHHHVKFKNYNARIEMIRRFFKLVKDANDNSCRGYKRSQQRLLLELKRVANFSICKCQFKNTIDCR